MQICGGIDGPGGDAGGDGGGDGRGEGGADGGGGAGGGDEPSHEPSHVAGYAPSTDMMPEEQIEPSGPTPSKSGSQPASGQQSWQASPNGSLAHHSPCPHSPCEVQSRGSSSSSPPGSGPGVVGLGSSVSSHVAVLDTVP